MRAIERCRTAALGGHVDACDACGHLEISYNSCRNRFCPKCQGRARAEWVEAREAELLPVEYFHGVFTLRHVLNPLLRQNRALLLNLLFRAVSETLLEFGRRHLGGEIGVLAVLHTSGQTLCEHNHLHTIVTGGALSADDSMRPRAAARGSPGPERSWRRPPRQRKQIRTARPEEKRRRRRRKGWSRRRAASVGEVACADSRSGMQASARPSTALRGSDVPPEQAQGPPSRPGGRVCPRQVGSSPSARRVGCTAPRCGSAAEPKERLTRCWRGAQARGRAPHPDWIPIAPARRFRPTGG
jgi:hypothetical protein